MTKRYEVGPLDYYNLFTNSEPVVIVGDDGMMEITNEIDPEYPVGLSLVSYMGLEEKESLRELYYNELTKPGRLDKLRIIIEADD